MRIFTARSGDTLRIAFIASVTSAAASSPSAAFCSVCFVCYAPCCMDVPVQVLHYFRTAPLAEAEQISESVLLILKGRQVVERPQAPPPKIVKTPPTQIAPTPPKPNGIGRQKDAKSIRARCETVLRQEGRPMTADALKNSLMEHFQKTATPDVVRSVLGKLVRKGDTFSRPGEGLFGLLEWAAEPSRDQDDGSA